MISDIMSPHLLATASSFHCPFELPSLLFSTPHCCLLLGPTGHDRKWNPSLWAVGGGSITPHFILQQLLKYATVAQFTLSQAACVSPLHPVDSILMRVSTMSCWLPSFTYKHSLTRLQLSVQWQACAHQRWLLSNDYGLLHYPSPNRLPGCLHGAAINKLSGEGHEKSEETLPVFLPRLLSWMLIQSRKCSGQLKLFLC